MVGNPVILSVCIPTYNRSKELKEIVDSILSLERRDIEVVVTDNVSTDDTLDILQSIQDDRLRICKNEKPIPGLCNMIEAIFNANGKYALYCNDRDLLYPSAINRLVNFLKSGEYSYIKTSRKLGQPTNTVKVFKKGYDSLMHHMLGLHPTGMVFNCELIREHDLDKEKYFGYAEYIYVYDFLAWDLMHYDKAVFYDYGCWAERPPIYVKTHKSGINSPWYLPKHWIGYMQKTLDYIFNECRFELTEVQSKNLALGIMKDLATHAWTYKRVMSLNYLTAHIGSKPRLVSTPEMLKYSIDYSTACTKFLRERGYPESYAEEWKKYIPQYLYETICNSLKEDRAILGRNYREFKRQIRARKAEKH